MKEKILVVISKIFENSYEREVVFTDGKVLNEISRNGEIKREEKLITVTNDVLNQLKEATQILDKICIEEPQKYPKYEIYYCEKKYYSYDLYLDLHLIIRFNQIRKLSIFDKYDTLLKSEQIAEEKSKIIKKLDEYEKNKNIIDIDDEVVNGLDYVRDIIKINLIKSHNINFGESRFFSKYIDIADSIEIPDYMDFIGQLDLSEISKYDRNKLLPKEGFLYFFQSPMYYEGKLYNYGKVIYSDDVNLVRKQATVSHELGEDLEMSFVIDNMQTTLENFQDRYDDGEYNDFAGEDINKMFGFFTDCQQSEEDIIKISKKYVVLLQLGSNIYGEGVTTFLIPKEDLKNKNFNNIIFNYSQS